MKRFVLRVGLLGALLLSNWRSAVAQEPQLPAELQATLMVRVMTFEKSLQRRLEDDLVIGIVFQPEWSPSREAKDAMVKALRVQALTRALNGTIRVVELPLDRDGRLPSGLREQSVDVVYVTQLRALEPGKLSDAFRAARVISFSGAKEYAKRGLAIGLTRVADRPAIEINLAEVRATGAEFSSQLMRVAEIVKGN